MSVALAAEERRISGSVLTGDKEAVSGAVVSVLQPQSGWTRAVLSNAQGQFFLRLSPGVYLLEANKPGYKRVQRNAVVSEGSDALAIDLRLTTDPAPQSIAFRAVCTPDQADGNVEPLVNCTTRLLLPVMFPPVLP